MRTDENGNRCPATLGEYRDMMVAIRGENCGAVKFLDMKIRVSPRGRDEPVLAADSQVRILLMSMLK